MTDIEALHTAARRYCITQAKKWAERYSRMIADSQSRESLNVYPRYQVLQAILTNLERQTPDSFPDIRTARSALLSVGRTAEDVFTGQHAEEGVAMQAHREERERFCRYVDGLKGEALSAIEPLPYRRVLGRQESDALWDRLRERWAIREQLWHPLTQGEMPQDVLAFQASEFHRRVGSTVLRNILADQGITRVWELREFGEYPPEYEIDVSWLEPFYNGSEGYWASGDMDWLIYASHEDSLTFAGAWLVNAVKEAWADWPSHLWEPFIP